MERSTDAFIQKLAAMRDPKTDKWLHGRKAIMGKVVGVTEWQVRKNIEFVRGNGIAAASAETPRQAQNKKQEKEVMSIPRIYVTVPKLPAAKKPSSSTEEWVIGSDPHSPYQHDPSCSIFYQIIEHIKPTKVILLGDVVNLDLFSRYDKIPGTPSWVEDVASAGIILGNVKQAAPNAELEWWEGNHEQRLKKHLSRHDPILYDKLSIEKLFTISDNTEAKKAITGWKYIPETEAIIPDLGIVIKHGNTVRRHTGMSAAGEIDNLLMSVIMGHAHRLGLYRKSSGRSRYLNEQPLFGMETGCLCKYDIPYRDGQTSNWQHGFGVLSIYRNGDGTPLLDPTIVEISNKKAVFRGKIFRA